MTLNELRWRLELGVRISFRLRLATTRPTGFGSSIVLQSRKGQIVDEHGTPVFDKTLEHLYLNMDYYDVEILDDSK